MFTSSLPKISCLLVTANGRWNVFLRSLECYENQIYPNRELVIVNEGSKEYQALIAERVQGIKNVKLVFLDGRYTLGALRNISVGLCSGDLFVQWDDDDFNMPERLGVQYSFLSRHPDARVCFLSDQLHYYFEGQTLFWENWLKYSGGGIKKYSLIPGTIMAYKDGFKYTYPASGQFSATGEDTVLTNRLCDENEDQVVLLSGKGHLNVYSYHGKNVWDKDHHVHISKNRSENASHMVKHKKEIHETLEHLKLDSEIQVMGRDGLGFVYWRKDA